jgi:hypothetical protein
MIFDSDFHAPVAEQPLPLKQGWHMPMNARKWHYYSSSGVSLCGKWVLYGGIIRPENQKLHASDDDCANCRRRWELLHED